MPAGYSRKPLAQKLGIKKGDALALSNAPDDYDRLLGKLPDGVTVARELEGRLDFIQLFATERASLEREFPKLEVRLERDGMIWVSWPKASSRQHTDLSDRVVREVGLKNDLVDVKVCAIDESWSALKFVRRLKDRMIICARRIGKPDLFYRRLIRKVCLLGDDRAQRGQVPRHCLGLPVRQAGLGDRWA